MKKINFILADHQYEFQNLLFKGSFKDKVPGVVKWGDYSAEIVKDETKIIEKVEL